jgi:hypothetical protein
MKATVQASALDATVEAAPQPNTRKLVAAVEYHRREHAAALESVRRLEGKADKLRAHAEQADADLATARAEALAAGQRVSDAEQALEEAS